MTDATWRSLGTGDPDLEYATAASMVSNGPRNKAGELYPTDSEAPHANNKAIDIRDILSLSSVLLVETRYSNAPSTIPMTPNETVARLPRYNPAATNNAGTTANTDAPAYFHTRLARSSGTAPVLSRYSAQRTGHTPRKLPKFR